MQHGASSASADRSCLRVFRRELDRQRQLVELAGEFVRRFGNPAASQGPAAVPPVSAMSDRYGLPVGNCGSAFEGVIRNIERENVLIWFS
jgi:hypothetical protein